MVEQFAYYFKVKIDFFFWREFFGLYEFMVLHAGIGLVVVSTKSVPFFPLQLKESPFTFFFNPSFTPRKNFETMLWEKLEKSLSCGPNFRILFFRMCFGDPSIRGPLICLRPPRWQTRVFTFIKGVKKSYLLPITYRVDFHKKKLNRFY